MIIITLVVILLFLSFAIRRAKKDTLLPTPTISPYVDGITYNPSPSNLSWISTDGEKLVDSSKRPVLLRGFVTTTNNPDGSEVNYTLDDYKRMKQLGANYQSIRIGANAIGAWPSSKPNGNYFKKLDQMVSLAAEAGIYSEFKLTIYDVPAFRGLARGKAWQQLWENKNNEQETIINAWRQLWQRYKAESAVVGYDLLNEPEKGSLNVNDDVFITNYLKPFYKKLIDELRKVNSRHLALFQPPFGSPPFNVSLERDQIVYAPHFYPNIEAYLRNGDFSTASYKSLLDKFRNEAILNQAPLLIGEYGMPWDEKNDGNKELENNYRHLEQTAVNLFDQYSLSFSRPWFADDRAGVSIRGLRLNWALVKGKGGLDGELREFITEPFSSVARKSK